MAASGSRRTSTDEFIRARSISGPFDVQSASRALDLIMEGNLHGSITLSDGLVDVAFFFTRGGLRVIAAGRKLPSLTNRLVGAGIVTAKDAKKVQSANNRSGRHKRAQSNQLAEERDRLIESGIGLVPEDIDAVAAGVITEVFLDCLFWDDPQYEATTGEPNQEIMQRRDLSAVTLSLGIKPLLKELQTKIRSVSEVRRTVASMQVISEPTPKGRDAVERGLQLGEGAQGQRRTAFLKAVVKEPGLGAAALAKRLKAGELETASRLNELSVEGYLTITRKARTKKEELDRIRKMEEALDVALNQLLRRLRLASDTAGVGDQDSAARHLSRAGGILLDKGRGEEAVNTFKGALKMSENSLEAREGFVKGLWATNREKEAAQESHALGARYLELNLPGRARKVLERALGFEEQSDTLDLLVKSFVKMRKPKLAAAAGERLVNRLRREGRTEEAREAAAAMLGLGGDKKALMKAAGIDRRKAVALLVLGGVISLGFVPVKAEEAARERYANVVENIRAELTTGHELDEMDSVLARLAERVEPVAQGDPNHEITERAKNILESVNDMRADCQQASELYAVLPWREQSDCELVWAQLETLQARSEAFSGPLERLRGEVGGFVGDALSKQEDLVRFGPTQEAYDLAVAMREEYRSMPKLLERSVLAVSVVTSPPGARVTYGGLAYSSKTPLDVRVPLAGTRQLELYKSGYERYRKAVNFDILQGVPQLVITLERIPERDTDTGAVPVVRGTRPPSRISSSGTPRTEDKPRPTKPRRVAQVELRDGYVRGKRNPKIKFVQDKTYFARGKTAIKLSPRYRATVKALSRIDGTRVYLEAFTVLLYVKRRKGWRKEYTKTIELDEPLQRAVVMHPGGIRKVQVVGRALRLDPAELREEVSDALNHAIRTVLAREKARR